MYLYKYIKIKIVNIVVAFFLLCRQFSGCLNPNRGVITKIIKLTSQIARVSPRSGESPRDSQTVKHLVLQYHNLIDSQMYGGASPTTPDYPSINSRILILCLL